MPTEGRPSLPLEPADVPVEDQTALPGQRDVVELAPEPGAEGRVAGPEGRRVTGLVAHYLLLVGLAGLVGVVD
jgi:hypothetical protein